MVAYAELTEFDAASVAQAIFDGSKPDLLNRGANWQFGDYVIKSPNEIWHLESDGLACKEDRLSRFVGGVAYALAVSGEVAPETVTSATVSAVCDELERVICINLHKDGEVAGAAEYARVQSSRRGYRERQKRIKSGEEKQFLSMFDYDPIDYQRTSFE
ncbi:MAG TPA: hypothetical protein VLE69_04245 [Candidatus Saccharimonadales bacterium]|nr:hypothetical protein [Candidatus Saccharimonadales bacterium]